MYNKLINILIEPKSLISYFGVLPLLFIYIDIYKSHLFDVGLLKNFIIFYCLIIFTFIGAMRWDFNRKSYFLDVLCGFLPSLISSILIFFTLSGINHSLIYVYIILCFILQLIADYVYSQLKHKEKYFFLVVRLPVTLIVIFSLCYFIVV